MSSKIDNMSINQVVEQIYITRGIIQGLELAKQYMSLPMANSMGSEFERLEAVLANLEFTLDGLIERK